MPIIDEGGALEALEACVALSNHRYKLFEEIRSFNKEQLDRLEKVEKERDELLERYKQLKLSYNRLEHRYNQVD